MKSKSKKKQSKKKTKHYDANDKNRKERRNRKSTKYQEEYMYKVGDCNILTNKRKITSDATGVTAPTTSGGFGQ